MRLFGFAIFNSVVDEQVKISCINDINKTSLKNVVHNWVCGHQMSNMSALYECALTIVVELVASRG